MKAEHINIFLESLNNMFSEMAHMSFVRENLCLKTKFDQPHNNIIMLGITGDLRGNVVVGLDDVFVKKIASQMIGYEMTEINDIVKSAVGELFNMILGRASIMLSNQGKTIDITPPTYISGTNLDITVQYPLISLNLKHEEHYLNFDISIKEK